MHRGTVQWQSQELISELHVARAVCIRTAEVLQVCDLHADAEIKQACVLIILEHLSMEYLPELKQYPVARK